MSPILLLSLMIVAQQHAADATRNNAERCHRLENLCINHDQVNVCEQCADWRGCNDTVKTQCRNKMCNLLRSNCMSNIDRCKQCIASECSYSLRVDCYNAVRCVEKKIGCAISDVSSKPWDTIDECNDCQEACEAIDNEHQCRNPLTLVCNRMHDTCRNTRRRFDNFLSGKGPNSHLVYTPCDLCERACGTEQKTEANECSDKIYQFDKDDFPPANCKFAARHCMGLPYMEDRIIACTYCLNMCSADASNKSDCIGQLENACSDLWTECKFQSMYGHYPRDVCNLCQTGCEEKNATLARDCHDHISALRPANE